MNKQKNINRFFDRLEEKMNGLGQKINGGLENLDERLEKMSERLDEEGERLDNWGGELDRWMEEFNRAIEGFMPDGETAGRVYQNIVQDKNAGFAPAMPPAGGEALVSYFVNFSAVMSQCGRWGCRV